MQQIPRKLIKNAQSSSWLKRSKNRGEDENLSGEAFTDMQL
jgi:hypothetical protein